MVIVIHQSLSTQNALFYNEKKVNQKKAFFFQSGNTPTINPFAGSKQDRWNILEEIEERNTRVKKKGLHISVNPTVGDLVKLGDAGIHTEVRNLMEHLGYGTQPYFVYKHADLDRVHFHIVSTRIDQQTGKKIRDNYEKEKVQRFIKSLEQKYDLTKELNKEQTNLKFSASSRNLKRNLESLFGQLNRMEFINSKEMYDHALKLFNVEIRKAGRGYSVLVTDENGNPIRHPVKMRDFEERPMFYSPEQQNLSRHYKQHLNSDQTGLSTGVLKSLVLKELFRQMNFNANEHQKRNKQKLISRRKKGNRYKP